MITALIDGDYILYAAGFAGQKNELIVNDPQDRLVYSTRTEISEAYDDTAYEVDAKYGIFSRFVLDDESHFYQSAKRMIEGACEKIAAKFDTEVACLVLIAGDGNFRVKLATIRPYKGQRHVHAKPLMYNQIRQYLLDNWNAVAVHDQEVDDELAIQQDASTIIVSIDKDMLQVPGWHYNPNKGFMKVSVQQGLARLYRQCLTGDSVDNIAGCKGIGPKKAAALITDNMMEQAMWDVVLKAFEDDIDAIETMRLVYLRREDDETWQPPNER